MSSFDLKKPSNFDIFQSTDPKNSKHDIVNIDCKNLNHYKNHPFKLYTGERLIDMVESIKHNGIFFPLIVRPIENDDFNYEILSGHNRLEASKVAGLESVPCLIKEGLSEEDAYLIVTESNLIQRSFADLSHSERASALASHYDTIKKQGKRNDLITEIENLLLIAEKPDNDGQNETSSPLATKLRADEKTGEKYGLSKDTVARYIRVDRLMQDLKELLDNGKLPLRAGVSISYIRHEEQKQIYDYVIENDIKINAIQAEQLRQLYNDGKFTVAKMDAIFQGNRINHFTGIGILL